MPAAATEFFDAKTALPSAMRTREWSRVPAWTREASFFMAGVEEAETLQIYRDWKRKVLTGETSESEARIRIREELQRRGYVPAPGQKGTIKDLTSFARINVSLRTSVALAQGWAREQEQRLAQNAFPAKKLVRMNPRKQPRNWPVIWRETAVQLPSQGRDGFTLDPMVAQVGHPIWRALSDFGTPYDPLKWQTGMRQIAVSKADALRYGITRRPEEAPLPELDAEEAQEPSSKHPAPQTRRKLLPGWS